MAFFFEVGQWTVVGEWCGGYHHECLIVDEDVTEDRECSSEALYYHIHFVKEALVH